MYPVHGFVNTKLTINVGENYFSRFFVPLVNALHESYLYQRWSEYDVKSNLIFTLRALQNSMQSSEVERARETKNSVKLTQNRFYNFVFAEGHADRAMEENFKRNRENSRKLFVHTFAFMLHFIGIAGGAVVLITELVFYCTTHFTCSIDLSIVKRW